MNDETRKNLVDILQASEEIQKFTLGLNFSAYQQSPVTQRAVERDFEIIGEALSRIKRTDPAILNTISEHHQSASKFFVHFHSKLIIHNSKLQFLLPFS